VKRTKPADKLAKKKQAWLDRTGLILNLPADEVRQLLAAERNQSVRINTLTAQAEARKSAWLGQEYSCMPEGYILNAEVADMRDDSLVTSGQVFIQNAASWLPVLALDPQPDEAILDVCAAPGGKTSHIAAVTNNQARITANDNSRPRLAKLQTNLDRLGADVQRYTLFDATMLARKLEGQQFDRILIDAPCSGEGLMSINHDKDFASWSVAHIKRLEQLQQRILTQAWQLLAPGGTLVYSTCTMAPEEDEAVVDYLLRRQDDAKIVPFELELPNRVPSVKSWNGKMYHASLAGCLRLAPSPTIEAFFVCKLQKM